jgi:hypothetical protein
MSSQLPHEYLMCIEDKAKLLDKIIRAHKIKMNVMKTEGTDARAASLHFNFQVTKIMRDAERYGFL